MSDVGNPNHYPVSRLVDVAKYKPSIWGDRFLHYTPDPKVVESQEEVAKELKEEIYKELVSIKHMPLIEQLCLIDSIERLGVANHFEKEIEDELQRIHKTMPNTSSHDLFLASLRFRLFRQHGFKTSCDVFEEFQSLIKGSLSEVIIANDEVEGILSLYEASYVGIHGEDLLDEARIFTTSKLKHIQDQLSHPMKERVAHALHIPLHRRPTRVESIHYMKVYEQDPRHNKTLLRFSKVAFNLLQSHHKKLLSDLSRVEREMRWRWRWRLAMAKHSNGGGHGPGRSMDLLLLFGHRERRKPEGRF